MSDAAAERVIAAVEERQGELLGLAGELIGFDTTTRGEPGEEPREEAALQRHLAELLADAGAEIELWEPPAGELDGHPGQVPRGLGFAGRPQLLARFPGAGGPSLLFNGHIDVVSAEPRERWSSDPFRAEVRDGQLYGRGACDMKGGIAAMVTAARALASVGEPGGELLVNTVTDEEWNGAGALASAVHGVCADAAMVPEPSGFDAWVACRGVACATITVTGRPGHAETPQPGWREGGAVNAIEKAALVLEAIAELRDRWRRDLEQHPLLEPGDLVPTVIEGGEWWVSYPAACTLTVDITYLPAQARRGGSAPSAGDGRARGDGDDPDPPYAGAAVERAIEAWVRERCAADDWLAEHPPEFEWASNLAPGEVDPEHAIVSCALAGGTAVGRPGEIGALQGWHDPATLNRHGTPAISFGPAGISATGRTQAHAVDECVPVADLLDCAKAYALAALRWWEGGAGPRKAA